VQGLNGGYAQRRLRFPHPVDLSLTLGPLRHGRGDPTIRIDRTEAARATRTPHGPASQRIHSSGCDVEVEAWGPGARWLVAAASDLLGLDDDRSGFEPHHEVVRHLDKRMSGLRLGRSSAVIECLVPTILEQKVQSVAAHASYRRLVYLRGEEAPGPLRLRLPPAPEALAGLASHTWHPLGVERRRAAIVRGACLRAKRLEETISSPAADAYRRLTALPGIGDWTAAIVLSVARGDPDAVPTGDFHLPNRVAWVLAGEPRADDERMLELLEPYRGHRGRVVRLIEAGGPAPPRYGPRLALNPIEHY
jgi:3-methyladenine DNA glycosylase/8-oxoguanine DNA glycosylase